MVRYTELVPTVEQEPNVVKVDKRPTLYILIIIAILTAPLLAAISLWLLSISLFFVIAFLAVIRQAKYSVVALGDHKKLCKIFQSGKQECITIESDTQIRLITLHGFGKYCVITSTKDSQLELIVTGKYVQAKHVAEKAASITGATLFIDEPIYFHRFGISCSTVSPNAAVNEDTTKTPLSKHTLP
jgi:hypothetical protein